MGKSHPQDLCFTGFHQSSGENMGAEFLRINLLPLDQNLAVAAQALFHLLPKSRSLLLAPAASPCLLQPALALSLPIPSGQSHRSAVRRCG